MKHKFIVLGIGALVYLVAPLALYHVYNSEFGTIMWLIFGTIPTIAVMGYLDS